jgi:hypothetical protein
MLEYAAISRPIASMNSRERENVFSMGGASVGLMSSL